MRFRNFCENKIVRVSHKIGSIQAVDAYIMTDIAVFSNWRIKRKYCILKVLHIKLHYAIRIISDETKHIAYSIFLVFVVPAAPAILNFIFAESEKIK